MENEENSKKRKWLNLFTYVALGAVILFCVITAIILNFKNREYEDLKNKNDQVKTDEIVSFVDRKIEF